MYTVACPFWEVYGVPKCCHMVSNNIWPDERTRSEEDDVKEYTLKRKIGKKKAASPKKEFTIDEARRIGERLGINWSTSPFDVEQFKVGLNTELEHGLISPATNVTWDNPILTGKIALAHLNEFPDYYIRLSKMEQEAKMHWSTIKG